MQPLLGDMIDEVRNIFPLSSTARLHRRRPPSALCGAAASEKEGGGRDRGSRVEEEGSGEGGRVGESEVGGSRREGGGVRAPREEGGPEKREEKATFGRCCVEAVLEEKWRILEAKEKEIEECSLRFRLREDGFQEQLAEFQLLFSELKSRQRQVTEQVRQWREIESNTKHCFDESRVGEEEFEQRVIEISNKVVTPDLCLAKLSKKEDMDEKEKRFREIELKEKLVEEMRRESELKEDEDLVKSLSSGQLNGAKRLWSDAPGDGNHTESSDLAPMKSVNLSAEQP
ncbi:unnamed protein product [Linum trigynum]|uniref:Uncharacterized protein n=1 Tax=Linum trigynum TaxID=586398 RepID=A0AAV2CID5_9ROSI